MQDVSFARCEGVATRPCARPQNPRLTPPAPIAHGYCFSRTLPRKVAGGRSVGETEKGSYPDDIRAAAELRTCRPRFRAGRGRLAVDGGRATIPRFRVGHRHGLAGTCASAPRAGDRPTGRQGDAHVQPLPYPAGRAAGPAAGGRDVRRQRVLLQFGRRGERGHDQDDAPRDVRCRQARALPDHLLRGRVPRPHPRHARRHRQSPTTWRASARWWKVSTTSRSTT